MLVITMPILEVGVTRKKTSVAQGSKNCRTWFQSYSGYSLEIMCDLNLAIAHSGLFSHTEHTGHSWACILCQCGESSACCLHLVYMSRWVPSGQDSCTTCGSLLTWIVSIVSTYGWICMTASYVHVLKVCTIFFRLYSTILSSEFRCMCEEGFICCHMERSRKTNERRWFWELSWSPPTPFLPWSSMAVLIQAFFQCYWSRCMHLAIQTWLASSGTEVN